VGQPKVYTSHKRELTQEGAAGREMMIGSIGKRASLREPAGFESMQERAAEVRSEKLDLVMHVMLSEEKAPTWPKLHLAPMPTLTRNAFQVASLSPRHPIFANSL
jgi:hypothetical protein